MNILQSFDNYMEINRLDCNSKDNIRSYYNILNGYERRELEKCFGKEVCVGWKNNIYVPFDAIGDNKRIILYAAGQAGKSYYESLTKSGLYDVVLWVDKNWEKIQAEANVCSIDNIMKVDYDVILIAIQDEKRACDVISDLIGMGINRNRIIWEYRDSYTDLIDKLEVRCKNIKNDHRKSIFLMNTPDHGNMGDHQIAIQELQFFNEFFPEYKIEEVSGMEWDYYSNQIKKKVSSDDLIMITGGGYMGDLWEIEDNRVKDIIDSFPDNYIVFMPQTFYYCGLDDKCREDRVFYSERKNILFIHRENNSMQFFLDNIVSDVKRNMLYPDMAFYDDIHKSNQTRGGILLCIRIDKERIGIDIRKLVTQYAIDNNIDYSAIDTDLGCIINKDVRDKYIDETIHKFGSVRLVVTDRLHGMFFAAITQTPCIAIDNISKKVSGVYEWVKEFSYVTCINADELNEDKLNKYLHMKAEIPETLEYRDEYVKMADSIKQWCACEY